MDYKSIAGVCLLAAGIVILLVALGLGYGLYTAAISAGSAQATQGSANITLSNGTSPSMATIVGAVVSTMASQLPVAKYMSYAIAAIFLALFASIGYKISELGIHMLAPGRGKDDKR